MTSRVVAGWLHRHGKAMMIGVSSLTTRLDVSGEFVDIHVASQGWRARARNRMMFVVDRRGGRRIIDVGEIRSMDDYQVQDDAVVVRPFDSANPDPAMVRAFVRYWSQAFAGSKPLLARLRVGLSAISIDLYWTEWSEIPPSARVALLRAVVYRHSTVWVNGRLAARWTGLRAVADLRPAIERWAIE
jgi:hypothetical protein